MIGSRLQITGAIEHRIWRSWMLLLNHRKWQPLPQPKHWRPWDEGHMWMNWLAIAISWDARLWGRSRNHLLPTIAVVVNHGWTSTCNIHWRSGSTISKTCWYNMGPIRSQPLLHLLNLFTFSHQLCFNFCKLLQLQFQSFQLSIRSHQHVIVL